MEERKTVQIPEDLHREVKSEAAKQGKSVKEVVVALLEKWLSNQK